MITPIQVRTQWAELRMQRTPPVLGIERTDAQVQLRSTPGWIDIDRQALDAATGRPSPAVFGAERAALARQAGLEGIARRAREGDALMRIEAPGNAITRIARDRLGPSNSQAEITVRMAPPPQLDVTPGRLQVEVRAPALRMTLLQGSQVIDATRGEVQIDVRA